MIAIDVVIRVFGFVFLRKVENQFAFFTFVWSLFVASRRSQNDNCDQYAIQACNVLRLISIPLFHRSPVDWLHIFTTTSIFSFILQKKVIVGIVLAAILHTILYFLLLGLSPLTYWNVGKQFFNILIWPDDPRQLSFQIGMSFAVIVMAIHFLIHFGEKLLELVRFDWFLFVTLIHPSVLVCLLPTYWKFQVFTVSYSLLLISLKYGLQQLTQFLSIVFVFIYMILLTT